MSLIQLIPPDQEPVSLVEAKAYTRIDGDQDDGLLRNLIKTARNVVETYTTRSLMTQTWRYTFQTQSGVAFRDEQYLLGHRTRGYRGIELPRSPFVKMVDKPQLICGDQNTAIDNYKLDTAGRVAHIHFENVLLDQFPHRSAIQIDFEAGYGPDPESIPDPLKQAILVTVAQLYDNPRGSNDNGYTGVVLSPSIIQLIRPYRVLRLI